MTELGWQAQIPLADGLRGAYGDFQLAVEAHAVRNA